MVAILLAIIRREFIHEKNVEHVMKNAMQQGCITLRKTLYKLAAAQEVNFGKQESGMRGSKISNENLYDCPEEAVLVELNAEVEEGRDAELPAQEARPYEWSEPAVKVAEVCFCICNNFVGSCQEKPQTCNT